MHHVFEKARENMIEGQIRPNRVSDPVIIDALRRIPREKFVPHHLRSVAYADQIIAVGNGRYLAEPMVLARLVQAAEVKMGDIVLDIGCGTGYSAALLGALAGTVVGIERDKGMAQEADRLLRDLGIVNAAVLHHDNLRDGLAKQGPYNAILINGSVPAVPDALKRQLAEGGRLVTVISPNGHMGTAVRVLRTGDAFIQQPLFDAAVPVLHGFEAPETFVF
jgi:protein-L-isoaspartate(D-aspartate) O-methyltransferase